MHLTFDGADVELWLEPASLALGVGDDQQRVDLGQLERIRKEIDSQFFATLCNLYIKREINCSSFC